MIFLRPFNENGVILRRNIFRDSTYEEMTIRSLTKSLYHACERPLAVIAGRVLRLVILSAAKNLAFNAAG